MKQTIAALLVAGLAGACSSGPSLLADLQREPPAANTSPVRGRFEGWDVGVSVADARLGPLLVEVGPLERAHETSARPWIYHDVVLSNTAGRPLRFEDTRKSQFLRRTGPRLLAADEGCGYSLVGNSRVRGGACAAYLDAFVVNPDVSVTREITLFKELPGMPVLQEGIYRFDKEVAFRLGRGGKRYRQTITFLYDVERRPRP